MTARRRPQPSGGGKHEAPSALDPADKGYVWLRTQDPEDGSTQYSHVRLADLAGV